METQVDLKWISVVSLGTLVALLLNYDIAGGPYWYRDNFGEAAAYGFTVVFLFFGILTLSAATLYTSGIRNRRVYDRDNPLRVFNDLPSTRSYNHSIGKGFDFHIHGLDCGGSSTFSGGFRCRTCFVVASLSRPLFH